MSRIKSHSSKPVQTSPRLRWDWLNYSHGSRPRINTRTYRRPRQDSLELRDHQRNSWTLGESQSAINLGETNPLSKLHLGALKSAFCPG